MDEKIIMSLLSMVKPGGRAKFNLGDFKTLPSVAEVCESWLPARLEFKAKIWATAEHGSTMIHVEHLK